VNNAGFIIGNESIGDLVVGPERAFIAVPISNTAAQLAAIPEPASALLLVMGSFGLLGNRWRRHPVGRYEADQVRAGHV
jgi:hypothetical protein